MERQANSRHHRPRTTVGGAGHANRHSPQGGGDIQTQKPMTISRKLL